MRRTLLSFFFSLTCTLLFAQGSPRPQAGSESAPPTRTQSGSQSGSQAESQSAPGTELQSIPGAAAQDPFGAAAAGAEVSWKNIKPEKLDAGALRILPSNKLLRLTLNEDLGFTKVIIQDLNGNTLLEKPYDPGTDLDISILKPGNYFIKVISADRLLQGKFGTRRF